MRINKFLASVGLGSRRSCETLVRDRKIVVNGTVITSLATDIDPEHDVVLYNGRRIRISHEKIYIALNKPINYVVTVSDPHAIQTVFDLLPSFPQRIFPVGRLDKGSSGLLLLTNDGDFANLILHPRNKIPKTYLAKVKGRISPKQIHALRFGVKLDDGVTLPARVFIKAYDAKKEITKLRMTIVEGRNRQIRRMLKAVDSQVLELKRVQIGDVKLSRLNEGKWRPLKNWEIRSLRQASLTGKKNLTHPQ